jgi:hypothetical protein
LDQVVGEGIVIIQDENHALLAYRQRPSPPNSGKLSNTKGTKND